VALSEPEAPVYFSYPYRTGQNEKLSGNLVPYCWPGNVNAIVGVEMASAHAEYVAMLSMEGNLPQKTIWQV
jgi:hypothetical protein